MSIVEVTGLTKRFSTGRGRGRRVVEAVHGLSLRIDRGERVAYIGPNGAGKSTSIKMLTGVLHPDEGTATVLGLVPWRQRRELTRRIGTLFGQRSQLWFELPSRDALALLGAIHELEPAELDRRVGELGELLEATDLFDTPVRNLSLGQRMRCELAACLLHQPEMVFLDEPTIGLDLLAKQRFRELLVRLNEHSDTTVLLTSHDVADIESVAQRVVVINHGRVIVDSGVAAIRRTLLSRKLVEVALGEPGPPDLLSGLPGVTILSEDDLMVRLEVDTALSPIRAVLDEALDHLVVSDINVTDPPLERVISEIYVSAPPLPEGS